MGKLPLNNIKWLTEDEIKNLKVQQIDTEKDVGYILEVDLEYPPELHKKHSNFPLAPETIEINFENLSPYAKKALQECNNTKKYKDTKLCATFHDRKKYIVHIKNLQLYLKLGMKLKKIWRAISFTQKAFIAPFISKCTHERQKATTKFEQDQFKKVVSILFFEKNYFIK
jgi:hypothetical protein